MSKIDQEIRICFTVTLVCTHFAKFLIFNFLKGLAYSAVIAFDIALVAQKVKVQCCYIIADMLNLKKLGGVVVVDQ